MDAKRLEEIRLKAEFLRNHRRGMMQSEVYFRDVGDLLAALEEAQRHDESTKALTAADWTATIDGKPVYGPSAIAGAYEAFRRWKLAFDTSAVTVHNDPEADLPAVEWIDGAHGVPVPVLPSVVTDPDDDPPDADATPLEPKVCQCSTADLMRQGCRCGAMQ